MFNSPFGMVVAIVLIASVFSLAKHYLDTRAAGRHDERSGPDDETLALISRLEHRVEVLERIVTDSGYNLKREIDQL